MTDLQSIKKRVEELDAKASPGPWESVGNHNPYKIVWINKKEMYSTLELLPDDADFIAYARTALPALLRLVEQQADHMAACRSLLNVPDDEVLYQAIKQQAEALKAAEDALELSRWLPLPVGVNSPEGMFVGWIPFPMSEEDYTLMIETLELWKPMLTKQPEPAQPNT